MGACVLHRLSQRAPQIRRGVVEPGQLGFRQRESEVGGNRQFDFSETPGAPRRFSFRARALRIRAMESTKASLQKIAPGLYAWMQPTTGWSRNNAGLIAGNECA